MLLCGQGLLSPHRGTRGPAGRSRGRLLTQFVRLPVASQVAMGWGWVAANRSRTAVDVVEHPPTAGTGATSNAELSMLTKSVSGAKRGPCMERTDCQ